MPSTQKLLVVGGGQAASQLIDEARYRGYSGDITLVSEESVLPYQRPPLSKQYLNGTQSESWLLYRPPEFYQSNNVQVILNQKVTAIDRQNKLVALGNGATLEYDKLALTTGARARRLTVHGSETPVICYIRTLQDVNFFQSQLKHSRKIIIIGGGFIGLEAAAILVKMGLSVQLLASETMLLPRLGDAGIAEFLKRKHLQEGVDVRCNVTVAQFCGSNNGSVTAVCKDGNHFQAELVLAGIGAIPNTALAEQAGIACDNGILVNELCQTSDPDIYAAGDCTRHPNPFCGETVRLETVHNAVEQGRTAGACIAGHELRYRQIPWVWSDQYDYRLQSVGFINHIDDSVRLTSQPVSQQTENFSVLYFAGKKLVAANCINQPRVFAAVRRILNGGITVTSDQINTPQFDLTTLGIKTPQFNLETINQ